MKHIFLILVIFGLASCSNSSDETLVPSAFLGEYKILSATANIAIDGDFNGNFSNNFLDEFASYGPLYEPLMKISQDQDNRLLIASCSFPTMFRFPAQIGSTSTLVQQRSVGSLISSFDNKIYQSFKMKDGNGVDTGTFMLNYQVIANNKIKVTVNHDRIYNVTTNSWQSIIVEFVFIKK